MASEVSSSAYVSPPSIEELDTEQDIIFNTPTQSHSDKSPSPFGTAKTHQSVRDPRSDPSTDTLHESDATCPARVEVHPQSAPQAVLPPPPAQITPLDGSLDAYELLHIPHGLPLETIVEQASYSTLRTGRSSGATAASAPVLRHTSSAPSIGQTNSEIDRVPAALTGLDRRRLSQNLHQRALHYQAKACTVDPVPKTTEKSPRHTHPEQTKPPFSPVKPTYAPASVSREGSFQRTTSDALRQIFRKLKGDDEADDILRTSVLADRSNRKTPQIPPRQPNPHTVERFELHKEDTALNSQQGDYTDSASGARPSPSKKHSPTKHAHDQDRSPSEPKHRDTQNPTKTQIDFEVSSERSRSQSEHAPSRVTGFLSCHNDPDLFSSRERAQRITREELDRSPRCSLFPSKSSPSKPSASNPRSLMPAPLSISKKQASDTQQNVCRTFDSGSKAPAPRRWADALSDQDPFASPSLRSSKVNLNNTRCASSVLPIHSNTCSSMRGYDAAEDGAAEEGIAASDSSSSLVAGTSMYQNASTVHKGSRQDDSFAQISGSMSPSEPSSPVQVPAPLRVRAGPPPGLSAPPRPCSAASEQDPPRVRKLSNLLHITNSSSSREGGPALGGSRKSEKAADPALKFRYCAHGRLVVPPGVSTGTKMGNRDLSRFVLRRAQGCWRCEMQDARDTWLAQYGHRPMVCSTPTRSKNSRFPLNNHEHRSTVLPPSRPRFSIKKLSTQSRDKTFRTTCKPMTRARDSESSITPPPRELLSVLDSSGRRAVRTSSGWLFVPVDPQAHDNVDGQLDCEHRIKTYGLHKSASRRSIKRGGAAFKGKSGVCWRCRVGKTFEGVKNWLVEVVSRCGCGRRPYSKAKSGERANWDAGKDGSDDDDDRIEPVFVSDEEDFDADDEDDGFGERVELREIDVRPRARAYSQDNAGHTPPARQLLAKNQASFDSLRMKKGVGVRPTSRIAEEREREAEMYQRGRSRGRFGLGSERETEGCEDEDDRDSRIGVRGPDLPAGGFVHHDITIDERVGKARLHQPEPSSSSTTRTESSSLSTYSAEVDSEHASGTGLIRMPHRTPTMRGKGSGGDEPEAGADAEAEASMDNQPSLAQRELARQYKEMGGSGSRSLRDSLRWRIRGKHGEKRGEGEAHGEEGTRRAPGLRRARERSAID